jgi:predicted N-formylglutamate amidohydrolase
VPPRYRAWFEGAHHRLATHLGYDNGALELAHDVAQRFDAPLFYSTVTRLLADLNRSVHHRRLHSEALRHAPGELKQRILDEHYFPYRRAAEDAIARLIAEGHRVVHLSCHSFTPRLNGETRRADIGLLYDPSRALETALCRRWKTALAKADDGLVVRSNYPYRGTSDGFAKHLRRLHGARRYAGIEIEVNQKNVVNAPQWKRLRSLIVSSLETALAV